MRPTIQWLPSPERTLIGHGSHCLVYKVGQHIEKEWKPTEKERVKAHRKEWVQYKTYILRMASFHKCTTILQLISPVSHEYLNVEPKSFITLEYCPYDLFEVLTTQNKGAYDLMRPNFASHALQALTFVHWCGFFHCDVKLENFMMRPNGDVVLMDFNLSVPIRTDPDGIREIAKRFIKYPRWGTPRYKPDWTKLDHIDDASCGYVLDFYAMHLCGLTIEDHQDMDQDDFVPHHLVEMGEADWWGIL